MATTRFRGHEPLSWIAVALSAEDDVNDSSISGWIELLAEWRLCCGAGSSIDWTGFDDACRVHQGPWARRWLRAAADASLQKPSSRAASDRGLGGDGTAHTVVWSGAHR